MIKIRSTKHDDLDVLYNQARRLTTVFRPFQQACSYLIRD